MDLFVRFADFKDFVLKSPVERLRYCLAEVNRMLVSIRINARNLPKYIKWQQCRFRTHTHTHFVIGDVGHFREEHNHGVERLEHFQHCIWTNVVAITGEMLLRGWEKWQVPRNEDA